MRRQIITFAVLALAACSRADARHRDSVVATSAPRLEAVNPAALDSAGNDTSCTSIFRSTRRSTSNQGIRRRSILRSFGRTTSTGVYWPASSSTRWVVPSRRGSAPSRHRTGISPKQYRRRCRRCAFFPRSMTVGRCANWYRCHSSSI